MFKYHIITNYWLLHGFSSNCLYWTWYFQAPQINNISSNLEQFFLPFFPNSMTFQIRPLISKERYHKVPDALGIGAAKCGTGSLMFLDCHSEIVFRDMEARMGKIFYRVLCKVNILSKHLDSCHVWNLKILFTGE